MLFDVIDASFSLEELKNKYTFPTIIDRNNIVLYARQISNDKKILIVFLKDFELDLNITKYTINVEKILKQSDQN